MPGYSIRDYGNRVGHARQMAVLDRYGIRGSISLSTALCDHHPEIIAQCAQRGWEFFSHGIYNTRYTYGMSPEQEREMILDSMHSIHRHTGQHCAGYLAPALSHSELTLDLFAEAGRSWPALPPASIPATCSTTTSPHPSAPAAARPSPRFPIRWR